MEPLDGRYGSMKDDGSWDGMIKMLINDVSTILKYASFTLQIHSIVANFSPQRNPDIKKGNISPKSANALCKKDLEPRSFSKTTAFFNLIMKKYIILIKINIQGNRQLFLKSFRRPTLLWLHCLLWQRGKM